MTRRGGALLPFIGVLACVRCGGTAPAPAPAVPAVGVSPSASAAAPAPVGGPGKVTIKWGTASERDNFGFNVHRGEHPDGPFVKVNPDPIPGAGTTGSPSQYSYVDVGVTAGTTYYYWLESISLSGELARMSQNTVKIVAKPQDAAQAP